MSAFAARCSLLLLTLLLALPGCGIEEAEWECSPATCTGCCQQGRCVGGAEEAACGAKGVVCNVCAGGQRCTQNVCALGAGAGAGGGTGGGTAGGTGGAGGGAAGGAGGGSGGGSGGGGGTACVPQTDAELCTQAGRACGAFATTDRCGAYRPVLSCGTCASPSACGGAGQCTCTPESNQQLCARLGRSCGALTATDNCGNARSVTTCGSCAAPNSCSSAGQCGCASETDAQLCTRKGRACGSLTTADNCGRSRTVASCGTCAGSNTCSAGVCSCPAESDVTFCQRQGAACGAVSGTDLCGNPRSVASCGSCYGSNSCGGSGTANTCGCTPQSTADFCAARSKDCGTVAGTDNCGGSRSVDCGACTLPETCGGLGVANVCACRPETDGAFCSRLGRSCGSVTAADNCGAPRTVASCGSCTSPQSCGGGGLPNVCGCTGESDAAFCARLGKSCGTVSGTDTCGSARSAACGGCPGGATCGAAGASANTCLSPTPFPSSGVCSPNGFCFTAPTTPMLPLHDVWVDASGEVWACGGDGVVLRSSGGAVRGLWQLRNVDFNAVWTNGPNEVWLGGAGGLVLRFNGSVWEDLTIPGGKPVRDLVGDTQSGVWAVGDDNLIRRWVGGAGWTTPASLPSNSRDVIGVMQVGAQMRLLTRAGQYAWTLGSASTVVTALEVNDTWWRYSAQLAVSPTETYLAGQWWSSYSSNYSQELHKYVSGVQSSVALPGNSLSSSAGEPVFAARSASDLDLFASTRVGWHFDGLAWTTATIATPAHVRLSAGHGNAGTAALVGHAGALFERSGATWTRRTDWNFPAGITLPNGSSAVPLSGTKALVSLSQSADTFTGLSTARVLALWTEGGWLGARAVTGGIYGAWTPDGTAVWTIDSGSTSTLLRFDGAAWAVKGTLTGTALQAIGGSSESDLWLTGAGRVVRWNGATLADVPTPFSGTTEAIDQPTAVSPSLAFARVDARLVLRWDGGSWQVDAGLPSTGAVYALWKSPQGTVWVAGSFGVRKHQAGAWVDVPLPAGLVPGGVLWGTSDSDLKVNADTASTGAFDTVLSWNGSAWSSERYPQGFFNGQRVQSLGGRTWVYAPMNWWGLPGDKGGWSRPLQLLRK